MLKNKLNILFVFLILIFSISAVSASENTTDIQTISEIKDSTIIESGNNTLQSESNTYSDLQQAVNKQTDELNINQDYAYNNDTDSDYIYGITIVDKNDYVINGNGHAIDGSNQSRMFKILTVI